MVQLYNPIGLTNELGTMVNEGVFDTSTVLSATFQDTLATNPVEQINRWRQLSLARSPSSAPQGLDQIEPISLHGDQLGIDFNSDQNNSQNVSKILSFNEQIDFNRDQFNTQNALAIQQSNVEWRRRANLADTAAQNAINQENAKMTFSMTSAAQSFLWQELRDQADYNFRWANDTATRKVQAMIAAASAEVDVAKNWQSNFNNISNTINNIFGLGD